MGGGWRDASLITFYGEKMIKNPQNIETMTINVLLKDGKLFREKDVPPQPFGEHESIVSFWLGDVIRSYPMSEVEYFELVFVQE